MFVKYYILFTIYHVNIKMSHQGSINRMYKLVKFFTQNLIFHQVQDNKIRLNTLYILKL